MSLLKIFCEMSDNFIEATSSSMEPASCTVTSKASEKSLDVEYAPDTRVPTERDVLGTKLPERSPGVYDVSKTSYAPDSLSGKTTQKAWDVEYRPENEYMVKVATLGSVDAGKSSLIGVLTTDVLDNGNGQARDSIVKCAHELKSGRTSKISNYYISHPRIPNNIVNLIDLCGHKKYFKTTMNGVTSNFVDYGCVVIALNKGEVVNSNDSDNQRMTKEHIGVLNYLQVPFFIVLSKLDRATEIKKEQCLNDVKKIAKGIKKMPIFIHNIKEAEEYSQLISQRILPIFTISNKTGEGLETLKTFLFLLKKREHFKPLENSKMMYIATVYDVPYTGTVVSGTVRGNKITNKDNLFIGPIHGKFEPLRVKNIHNNKTEDCQYIENSQTGCLNIKTKVGLTKTNIRKGTYVVSEDIVNGLVPNIRLTKTFYAKVFILTHSTTITSKFSSVVHCRTIRQTAKMILPEGCELIRTGDTKVVGFQFELQPELVELGEVIFFREMYTKGIGIIQSFEPMVQQKD
jgi:GTPase